MLKFIGLFCAIITSCGLAVPAGAEDQYDIRGTKHGCTDFTVGAAWATYTSASLEDQAGSAVLGASLYWTEIMIKAPSAAVYICEAAAASCGANTTNKLSVASGATIVLPLKGLAGQSIALQGSGAGVTGQLCGYFRVSP